MPLFVPQYMFANTNSFVHVYIKSLNTFIFNEFLNVKKTFLFWNFALCCNKTHKPEIKTDIVYMYMWRKRNYIIQCHILLSKTQVQNTLRLFHFIQYYLQVILLLCQKLKFCNGHHMLFDQGTKLRPAFCHLDKVYLESWMMFSLHPEN